VIMAEHTNRMVQISEDRKRHLHAIDPNFI